MYPGFAVAEGLSRDGVGVVFDEFGAAVECFTHVVRQRALRLRYEADDLVPPAVSTCSGAGQSVVQDGGDVVRVVEAPGSGDPGQEAFDVVSVCFGAAQP